VDQLIVEINMFDLNKARELRKQLKSAEREGSGLRMEVNSNICENNYSNENQFSTKCDGYNQRKENFENDMENRTYELNKLKSMKEILTASENEIFELIHKDGGVILKFNAGMYELFRNSTESYFANSQIGINCKKTNVHDKASNNVETRNKVSSDNSGLYSN
jgi:hypothetical protein